MSRDEWLARYILWQELANKLARICANHVFQGSLERATIVAHRRRRAMNRASLCWAVVEGLPIEEPRA